MTLTNKELEIMGILWQSDVSMTVNEIVNAATDCTWSPNSIFMMMANLEKKRAVTFHTKSSTTKPARSYTPTLTYGDYLAQDVVNRINLGKPGLNVSIGEVIRCIRDEASKTEDGD